MTLFITNTVGFLVWLIILSILIPVVVFCLLVSILAGFHIFNYCEKYIVCKYNKAVDKLGGKFGYEHQR